MLDVGSRRVQQLTSTEALVALVSEWKTLWDCSPRATLFQSPEWLLAWWEHLGAGEMHALTLREEGQLIGLFPLFRRTTEGNRQISAVGAGISDSIDLLAAPGREAEVAAAMLGHLAMSDDWDCAVLPDVPANSPLLCVAVPNGIEKETQDAEPCPVLVLPRPVAELANIIPHRRWKKLSRARRRLRREFVMQYETADDMTSVDELFRALVRLHTARWATRGKSGVLYDERIRAVHSQAAPFLLERGWLRLHALRLDGEVAAVWYGFSAKGRFHYYLSGFDPNFSQYNLGTLLIGYAIEHAVREGADEFDFLRGGEPYKYDWGATDRLQRRIRLARMR